ncbi:MAG: trimethylamine methyltransferase family protein, partial [Anaerolineae bacterium]
MVTGFARLLTPGQVEDIHQASLEILETVGVLVRNEEARSRFAEHGCLVNAETHVVEFPRGVVEHFRAACPPAFTFHGRDAQYDRTIPDDGPLIITGSSAPDVIDVETGQVRRSHSRDIARIAHLVNELPGYDVFSICTTAGDAPGGQFGLSRFYPALKNCLKPVAGSGRCRHASGPRPSPGFRRHPDHDQVGSGESPRFLQGHGIP